MWRWRASRDDGYACRGSGYPSDLRHVRPLTSPTLHVSGKDDLSGPRFTRPLPRSSSSVRWPTAAYALRVWAALLRQGRVGRLEGDHHRLPDPPVPESLVDAVRGRVFEIGVERAEAPSGGEGSPAERADARRGVAA